ncbi:leucyl/phenylalanyl-tRNA--protein transferase [Verrucomicrobiaceae bacterium N1E253]|uniref:Leucyl/phenylalanyl-tRNA--protein transferase n=1 Tax=Oceaniferula marina TaxID=2748318 RepID=A0A851GIP8_9BACT|nr:leucyl/phenylalanyl-tRNA--protein transferase [Oceaniferula marina]NWK57373.1 leucyl/phenylalanyl-tRNA--protein transferase [Oceaniferula marina]
MMESISAEVLLGAYSKGVFPMAEDGEICWYSPEKRGVIPLDERFHVSKNLQRTLKKGVFRVSMNKAFREVMLACADREETWIDEVILESYCELHELGFGVSVESWDQDGLQGGLYGVALGRAFFGESMFSRKTDASKVALVYLVEWLRQKDFILLDTQWMTDHLRQFGGYELARDAYHCQLADALECLRG